MQIFVRRRQAASLNEQLSKLRHITWVQVNGDVNLTTLEPLRVTRFMRQLSDSDRFAGFVNFIEDNNFIYRGMMVG